MFCFRCGAEVEEGSVFCDKCGALMDDGPTQARNEAGRIDLNHNISTPSPNEPTAKGESPNTEKPKEPEEKIWAVPSSVSLHEKRTEPLIKAYENESESKRASFRDLTDDNKSFEETNVITRTKSDSTKSVYSSKSGGPRARNKTILAIIIIVVVAVLVLAGFFAFNALSGSVNQLSITPYEENKAVDTDSAASENAEDVQADEQVKDVPPFVGFKSVSATSELPTGGINTSSYVAANLIDGSASICWCEGAVGDGVGEFVTFNSPVRQTIEGFVIWNGYQASDYLYDINARPKTIAVYADDEFVGSFDLKDSGLGSQNIVFDEPVIAKTIAIEIEAVYAGSKYDDCCISEIDFY